MRLLQNNNTGACYRNYCYWWHQSSAKSRKDEVLCNRTTEGPCNQDCWRTEPDG